MYIYTHNHIDTHRNHRNQWTSAPKTWQVMESHPPRDNNSMVLVSSELIINSGDLDRSANVDMAIQFMIWRYDLICDTYSIVIYICIHIRIISYIQS